MVLGMSCGCCWLTSHYSPSDVFLISRNTLASGSFPSPRRGGLGRGVHPHLHRRSESNLGRTPGGGCFAAPKMTKLNQNPSQQPRCDEDQEQSKAKARRAYE
jgi:hypothetical protein